MKLRQHDKIYKQQIIIEVLYDVVHVIINERILLRWSGTITTPSECSAIWVLSLQWKSSKWHLLRKKSAKSSILLAAKIFFYFIVRLTGRGSL